MIFESVIKQDFDHFRSLVDGDHSLLAKTNRFGNTPVHLVAKAGRIGVMLFVLEHEVDIEARGIDGFTPLQYAVSSEDAPMVELLLERGADVHSKDDYGNDALFNAVMAFDEDDSIVKLLLAHNADPTQENQYGRAAIDLAGMPKNEPISSLLGES